MPPFTADDELPTILSEGGEGLATPLSIQGRIIFVPFVVSQAIIGEPRASIMLCLSSIPVGGRKARFRQRLRTKWIRAYRPRGGKDSPELQRLATHALGNYRAA